MSISNVFMYSMDDLEQISQAFSSQLAQAASGSKTSLPFILTHLPKTPLIRKHHARYQAMVVGGTYFQQAIVNRSPEGIVLHDPIKTKLPSHQTITELFELICSHTDQETSILTLNFAYALEPIIRDDQLDGVLLSGAKEHDFAEFFGKQVGLELELFLRQKLKRPVQVTISNDTLCLTLTQQHRSLDQQSVIGGIVGTGTNFGFLLEPHTFVNLESADFDQFNPSPTGEQINRHSDHPSKAKFEKEVSGAYLYQHYNLLIDQIGEDAPHAVSTDDLTIFAMAGDRPHHQIARKLIERSASLSAAQIAGIYQFKHQPKLTFVMEGSLFWHGWKYQELVTEYLVKLGIKEGSIHFSHIKNSSLLGSANLALINAPHIPIPQEEAEEVEEESEPAVDHESTDAEPHSAPSH